MQQEMRLSAAIGKKEYDDAISICNEMLEADEYDPFALSMIAQCYEWKDDYENALLFASKCLEKNSGDFSMLILAARHWSMKKDEDKTYYYVCRALENRIYYSPVIPGWVNWFIKLLSFFKKYQNIEEKVKMDQINHENRQKEEIKWAMDFKKWYESEKGGKHETPIH